MFKEKTTGNNILILGIGGGFDIFAGLPLFYDLSIEQQKNVVFANYSFSKFEELPNDSYELVKDNIIEGKIQNTQFKYYFPEGWMKYIFEKKYGINNPVYALNKTGVVPLRNSIDWIIIKHKIDMILLVDGGIDSIMTGTEKHPGTILEDFISLISVSFNNSIQKYIVCCGYGTETEEKMDLLEGLKNFNNKIIDVEYVGKGQKRFEFYKDVYEFAALNCQKDSHIHSRIIKSASGVCGKISNNEETIYTPFMQLWWLFDYDKVMQKNTYINLLRNTKNFGEAVLIHLKRKNYEKTNNSNHSTKSSFYKN